jgi:lipopolysaccharide/colanic/teichoic acid biosynthesis glycosyltransferase
MIKRGFDLLFALVGLALLSPVFLSVWILIKLDDGGPTFFRHTRVGQQGMMFQMLKFRTMWVGAEKVGPSITAMGDRRITRIGRILRKSKLDEVPQLWNVVKGEMSLVGPRPEVAEFVALYTTKQREVLALKPGITDEASVLFRDEESRLAAAVNPERFYIEHCMPRKIKLNLAYAQHANICRDVVVIIRTIISVWFHR